MDPQELDDPISVAAEVLAAVNAETGHVPQGLRRMLSDGPSGEDGRALLAGVRDTQLQQMRLRRRAAELEALFSTARELVRLQDVDAVLQRLVERAHELMGTDVTYLSEFEIGSGELRVRHSEGTATAAFRDLLVPAGFGLASHVARTREPVRVAKYEKMSDAPHDAHIDEVVRAEGLVAFLGVPLAVGDEVLGALFACNRFAYDFSPEQVLLLSAFADHAASVLRSARALADAEQAKERAEQAYRELERQAAATELAGVVHEELTGAVITGGTVFDVVATLARRLGGRVLALDAHARPLETGQVESADDLPPTPALVTAMARSQQSGHVSELRADGTWLVTAIVGADRVLGAIIAEDPDRLPDDVARRTLERAAQVAALVSFKQDAVSAIRAEHRARWLLALLGGAEPGAGEAPLIAPPTHLTGGALIELPGLTGGSITAIAERAVGEDGLVAQLDRRIVIAWTAPDVLAATERVRRLVADALRRTDVVAVAAARALIPAQLPPLVARLAADLDFLPALGVAGATVSSDAFAPYHALSPHDPQAVDGFISDVVGAVIVWDERRGTALFDTLAAYFDSGESRAAVAEQMHIHANTVQQRLDRVRALVAGDTSDPEFRFRLQSAVRLESLRRRVRVSRGGIVGAAGGAHDPGHELGPELVGDEVPHPGVDLQL